MRSIWLFVVLSLAISTSKADDACSEWLRETKGVPGQSDCELLCSGSSVDMRTFTCPLQCRDYCMSDCAIDSFWIKALDSSSAPFQSLQGEDRRKALAAISKLPKALQPKNLQAIVKASGSDPLARSNPASVSEKFIILFPIAFAPSENLTRVLFHEVSHHLVANEWAKSLTAYKAAVGWKDNHSRPGGFVEPDGRDSAEEDFANNIEYFVFDPEKLRETSSKAYSWIKKNLESKLKLQRGCGEKTKSQK